MPSDVLFVSDNPKGSQTSVNSFAELAAAHEAGMQVVLAERPGNSPVEESIKSGLYVISSFDGLCGNNT